MDQQTNRHLSDHYPVRRLFNFRSRFCSRGPSDTPSGSSPVQRSPQTSSTHLRLGRLRWLLRAGLQQTLIDQFFGGVGEHSQAAASSSCLKGLIRLAKFFGIARPGRRLQTVYWVAKSRHIAWRCASGSLLKRSRQS